MKILQFLFSSSLLIFMASCGNNATQDQAADAPETEVSTTTEAPASDTAFLTIAGDDQMRFDKFVLTAKAGQVVQLTLTHSGKMAKNAMGHNWVLLKQGVDINNFGLEASKAADNDYIPQSLSGDIITHTKMLGGGEKDTITFTAPERGSYPFICSFPGHYSQMKGEFIVE